MSHQQPPQSSQSNIQPNPKVSDSVSQISNTISRNGKGDLSTNMAGSGLLHHLHFEDNEGFFPPSEPKTLDTVGQKRDERPQEWTVRTVCTVLKCYDDMDTYLVIWSSSRVVMLLLDSGYYSVLYMSWYVDTGWRAMIINSIYPPFLFNSTGSTYDVSLVFFHQASGLAPFSVPRLDGMLLRPTTY